jgi:hypothetical protein
MNTLGVSVSYSRSLNLRHQIGEKLTTLITEAASNGKVLRLIGDNLNFFQRVKYESVDKRNHMVHMFASAVLAHEDSFKHLDDSPRRDNNFTIDKVIFDDQDWEKCMPGWIMMPGKSFVTFSLNSSS